MRPLQQALAAVIVISICSCAKAHDPRTSREAPPLYVPPEELLRLAAQVPDQIPVGPVLSSSAAKAQAGVTLSALGPRPVAFEYWSGVDDASGRTCAVIVDPRDGNVVYIAGAQGGVWKSVDAGANWQPLTDGLSSLASGSLAFDPADPDIIYYGTGEQHFSIDSFYGDGLFRSTDAGSSWSKVASKADVGSYISRVALNPADSGVIYVGSDRGFVRSTDGGATWTVTRSGGWCTDLAADPVTPSVVYAAIRSLGIFKSTDSGATWTALTAGLPGSGFARINIAIAPSNPLVLYASFISSSNSGLLGMYKTTNGGLDWSLLSATPNYPRGQGWYDNCLIVSPTDPDICLAGGVFPYQSGYYGVIRTTNGGASWSDVTIGLDGVQVHPDQHCFAFGPDGRLWEGNDGGVWSSVDLGDHWVNHNHRLALTQFYTVANRPADSNFLLGGTQDNGTNRYEGSEEWPQLSEGDGGPCVAEWDSPNIYYSTYVNMRYLTKWNEGNYVGDVTGPWSGERASWCNGPLVVDPNVPNSLLVGTHRVWRTTNSGGSWTALSGDLAPTSGHLRAIAVAQGASNTIYAAGSNGRVYVTTDAATWDLRISGLPLPTSAIPDIVLDPGDWQTATLCIDKSSAGRVFRTNDAGSSWTDITGDLPAGVRGMSLDVDFRTMPPRLYLGTDYGVYSSADGGVHWVKAGNIPNLAVYDLKVDAGESYLIAATHGRGMWRAALDATAPSVAVLSPNGGEPFPIGGSRLVTWSATDAGGVASVDVHLSTDGGATYPTAVAAGLPNTGSFAWTVPGPPSANCRIRVTAADSSSNAAEDESDADFAMVDTTSVAASGPPAARFGIEAAMNPFRPPASFHYTLERAALVTLEVFDAAGRQVRALDGGWRSAGSHSAAWDGRDSGGRNVSSGVFFVRLKAGASQQSQRITVVR